MFAADEPMNQTTSRPLESFDLMYNGGKHEDSQELRQDITIRSCRQSVEDPVYNVEE